MPKPKFKIDFDQVEKLASIQCTQEEIAAFLGCSVDTLYRSQKFMRMYKAGMNKGRMSLRRKQWKLLEKGDKTMLIWLGKQYLGQKEKVESTAHEHRVTTEMTSPQYAKYRKSMLAKDDC